MTPRKRLPMLMVVLGLAAACSPAGPGEAPTTDQAPSAWISPPRIEAVRRAAGGLTVSGQASPGARVVLRGGDGAAFAASADEAGRFQVQIGASANDLLLIPEIQTGQHAAPAPERLLILAGANGPAVMLAPGMAGRRLDGAGALGAVDSDGRMLALSGHAPATPELQVTVNGRPVTAVQPGPDGRWTAVAPYSGGAARVVVAGAVYDYPGDGAAETRAARAGAGWRLGWQALAGGRQVTWLPDVGE